MTETIILISKLIAYIGGLAWVTDFLFKKLPDFFSQRLHDDRIYKNGKQLQIDNYFRQTSSENMNSILDAWASLITDPKNSRIRADGDELTRVVRETVNYASDKTIKLLGVYFQHIFEKDKKEDYSFDNNQFVLVAMIISCLKYDFTGVSVEPLDIIKVSYRGYSENQQDLQEVYKQLKNQYKIKF